MTNSIALLKFALAILLFLCLLPMLYGFYELVRFAALVGFSILAFHEYKNKAISFSIVFACLAILFQPFFKIALGRGIWNGLDVIVALFLIVTLFKKK